MNYVYPRNKTLKIPLYVYDYTRIFIDSFENVDDSEYFPEVHFNTSSITTTVYGNYLFILKNLHFISLVFSSKFYDFYQYNSEKHGYVQIVFSKLQNQFFVKKGKYFSYAY